MENKIVITFVIQPDKFETEEDVLVSLRDNIHDLSVIYFESVGEHRKFIQWNGQNMAQELAEYAEQMWITQQT